MVKTRLSYAIRYAREKHSGQKYGKHPYIEHPLAVMSLVKRITQDEDIIVASVIHDVVEDCGVKPKEIEQKFGSRVSNIVVELSKNYTKPENIKSSEALMIKMADTLHNLISSEDCERAMKTIRKHQKTFFKRRLPFKDV